MVAKLGLVGVTLSAAILSVSAQSTTLNDTWRHRPVVQKQVSQVAAAPHAITDDEIASIARNARMAASFHDWCKTFKPNYELSEENTQKYLISALSYFDQATQSRIQGAIKDDTIAEKWRRELVEGHKTDPDPMVGVCEEILRRVGPNGTDAKGLLVEATGQSGQSPAAIEAEHRKLDEAEAAIPAHSWRLLAAALTDRKIAAHREEMRQKEAARIEKIKSDARSIEFDALSREPTKYAGTTVTFVGKVVQVMERGRDVGLRVDVTKGEYGFWTNTIYVDYTRSSDAEPRILEGDIIRLYGNFKGLTTYKAIMGQSITLPRVGASVIEPGDAKANPPQQLRKIEVEHR